MTNYMEGLWDDMKRAINLKASTPGQERFVKDMFFAGAWALWGVVTYKIPEMSDEEGEAIMHELDQEFGRFWKERVEKLLNASGDMTKLEDWP